MNDKLQAESFFTPAANTAPYFKAGFQGFAGSGKTYTMAQVAIGLHKEIGSTKPVVMFDTEKASRFLLPLFAKAGVQFQVKESRALADLTQAIALCESGFSDIIMIDSLSHVWENFLDSYKQKVRRTRLEFQDWGTIKPTWKNTFSDPFVRSRVHILFSGRAGYEYENEKNDETGKREIFKSGVKMKVEGETAYEPDVLVYMERFEEVLDEKAAKKVWREATILKDRSGLIDGKTIVNPTYADFQPVIAALLTNPTDAAVQVSADDKSLFDTSDEQDRRKIERRICLEEVVGLLEKAAPGQTAKEKKFRGDMIEKHFGTRSWTMIETRTSLDNLQLGLDSLKAHVVALMHAAEVASAAGEPFDLDAAMEFKRDAESDFAVAAQAPPTVTATPAPTFAEQLEKVPGEVAGKLAAEMQR